MTAGCGSLEQRSGPGMYVRRASAVTSGVQLNFARAVYLICDDAKGDVYVPCRTSIQKITIATGKVELIAGHPDKWGAVDGIGSAARFRGMKGIAIDPAGARLFVCDKHSNTIRQITLSSGASLES
jgi:hypothetical protein